MIAWKKKKTDWHKITQQGLTYHETNKPINQLKLSWDHYFVRSITEDYELEKVCFENQHVECLDFCPGLNIAVKIS